MKNRNLLITCSVGTVILAILTFFIIPSDNNDVEVRLSGWFLDSKQQSLFEQIKDRTWIAISRVPLLELKDGRFMTDSSKSIQSTDDQFYIYPDGILVKGKIEAMSIFMKKFGINKP